jgi:phosphatidylglycerol:prolipoprotein diacylglycerol transferase
VLAMTIFGYFYSKKVYKKDYMKIFSISFIGISLYQAIGKLGCFSAGCCYGKPTSFFLGMNFKYLGNNIHPYAGKMIHPTQLYESFFNLVNFSFLLFLFKRNKTSEKIIGFYFINYGLIRFAEEYLRNDPGRGYLIKNSSSLLSLSVPQIYSLIFILFGISLCNNFFTIKKDKEKNI